MSLARQLLAGILTPRSAQRSWGAVSYHASDEPPPTRVSSGRKFCDRVVPFVIHWACGDQLELAESFGNTDQRTAKIPSRVYQFFVSSAPTN